MPTNYILLGVFTLCMSFLVSNTVMQVQEPIIVVEAAALTLGITVAITVYAARTKTDFTVCGPVFYIIFFLSLILVIFVLIFGPKFNFLLAGFGAFLSSFYLIIDTQMILAGTCESHRKFQIDEESYIMAALVLYLDIINLFLYILELLGKNNN